MAHEILCVSSEAYPIIKTGGLADVVGALPLALSSHDMHVTTLLPGYKAVMAGSKEAKILHSYDNLLGVKARLLSFSHAGLDLIVLDAPALYAREVGPYADQFGADWPDNWQRFAALGRVASDLAGGLSEDYQPDLVHAHDWQAAMACVYMKYGNEKARATPNVLTIHNLAFQGRFNSSVFAKLELPPQAYNIDGLEYYGDVSFLKGGLVSAYAITTVSPTYSEEIKTSEFGMGLEGMINLRHGHVSGIVNGIDTDIWDPANDAHLIETYSASQLSKRKANKREIEKRFGLETGDGPIFCVISRLTWQKGIDVLVDLFDDLVAMGARLVILGTGDAGLEAAVKYGATRHQGRIGVRIGYDEGLSHLLQGGSDAILVPSRFEPCGLTQLYGLRYGCIPIVARTGGLADTIIDANEAALNAGVATGIQFDKVTHGALHQALSRAVDLYAKPKAWASLQKSSMKGDYSWSMSGQKYAELYLSLLPERAKPQTLKEHLSA